LKTGDHNGRDSGIVLDIDRIEYIEPIDATEKQLTAAALVEGVEIKLVALQTVVGVKIPKGLQAGIKLWARFKTLGS
jgi:hypothetical protein